MDRDAFVAALGPAFENAPWVAAGAWSERPFASVAALHAAMLDVVRRAPEERQLAFLCGHPELAGREAQTGTMTAESVGEQRSAGLNAMTGAERNEMQGSTAPIASATAFPSSSPCAPTPSSRSLKRSAPVLRRTTEIERRAALEQIGLITRGRIDALVKEMNSSSCRPWANLREEQMAMMICCSLHAGSSRCQAWRLAPRRFCPRARHRANADAGARPGSRPIVRHGVSPRLTVHAIDIYHGSAGTGLRIDFSKKEGESYKLIRTVTPTPRAARTSRC